MPLPIKQVRAIRRKLGSVWNVFFGGFGKLTPVQMESMPLLLQGLDCVIASPTASGKTEAALAPITRKLLDRGVEAPGPGLLYVIPTRALVADMERRFSGVFADLGLTAAFRTSDSPHMPSDFVQLLFTTPESLDSLLCRVKGVWRNVHAVVLDELHLLDNTYRGDQLRVLLNRLELDWLEQKPHRMILSATIPEPEKLAERYLRGGGGDARVVTIGEPRSLRFSCVRTLGEAIARCKEERRHKALVFCNSRKDCESLAAVTVRDRVWPADGVFVHHGSLSRAVRKETEAGFRERKGALCFATTTLELGVDIGDVSAAVMYRPPLDGSSFIQRLGRACRREKSIFALGVALTDEERAVFGRYERFARRSLLEPVLYSPDYSVVVQQTLSLLFSTPRGMASSQLQRYVLPICPEGVLPLILDKLTADGYVRRRGQHLRASEKTMDMGERGEIHTNIADTRMVQVVDSRTGRALGEVTLWSVQEGPFVLAGRVWNVLGRSGGKLMVKPSGKRAGSGAFARRTHTGRYFGLLPPEVQALMHEPQP